MFLLFVRVAAGSFEGSVLGNHVSREGLLYVHDSGIMYLAEDTQPGFLFQSGAFGIKVQCFSYPGWLGIVCEQQQHPVPMNISRFHGVLLRLLWGHRLLLRYSRRLPSLNSHETSDTRVIPD